MQFPSAMGFPNPLPQLTVETPNRTKHKHKTQKKKKKKKKKKEDRVVQ
jgi:hypothetical protein